MTGKSTSDFVRRKFTITERLDAALVTMADQHYQGNVSLCLRTAIESHQAVLRGEGEFAAHRAANSLERLEEEQAELGSAIEAMSERITEQTSANPEPTTSNGIELSAEETAVYDELGLAESALRIEDIMERLDIGPSVVLPALASLVDRGLVVPCRNESHRYHLAGYGGRS